MDVGQRFPQIEIEMLETSRTRLVTAIRNAVVDIAIVPGATSLPETNTMSLWSERIMVAVPETHSLVVKEAIYWIDLRDEKLPLSRGDPGPELQDPLVAKLASQGDRPNIVRHDVSRRSLKSLVAPDSGSRC
jgi:DNA-binding transcriptional LysR family regulator